MAAAACNFLWHVLKDKYAARFSKDADGHLPQFATSFDESGTGDQEVIDVEIPDAPPVDRAGGDINNILLNMETMSSSSVLLLQVGFPAGLQRPGPAFWGEVGGGLGGPPLMGPRPRPSGPAPAGQATLAPAPVLAHPGLPPRCRQCRRACLAPIPHRPAVGQLALPGGGGDLARPLELAPPGPPTLPPLRRCRCLRLS